MIEKMYLFCYYRSANIGKGDTIVRLVDTKCPHCGANLNVDMDNRDAACSFCHARLLIDDEVQHIRFDNSEEMGYQFEKGRQRAQAEAEMNRYSAGSKPETEQEAPNPPEKKRKTWLWIIGWIFIFPVPLTIIMIKKKDISKKIRYGAIAAAWIVYLAMTVISGLTNGNSKSNKKTYSSEQTTTEAVTAEQTSAEMTFGYPMK